MRSVGRNSAGAIGELEDEADLELSIECDEPLSRHSTLRIGGPASIWAEVGSRRALSRVMEWARRNAEPLYVVGLGSNALFSDEGISGVVVRLVGDMAQWDLEDDRGEEATVRVGGGCVNAHLVRGLLDDGWIGAEFLRLVPGTFGGAVAMNAGTKEAELETILVDAQVFSAGDDGVEEEWLGPEQLGLRYRHSDLGAEDVVAAGRIRVRRGDVEAARESMERDRERRDATQPYKLASAGSTFANPEGDYAGRLIDEAGLKGAEVGGARISETHANFFINDGGASAKDFLRLMALARSEVRDQFGVELRPEVEFVGWDGLERMREFERDGELERD